MRHRLGNFSTPPPTFILTLCIFCPPRIGYLQPIGRAEGKTGRRTGYTFILQANTLILTNKREQKSAPKSVPDARNASCPEERWLCRTPNMAFLRRKQTFSPLNSCSGSGKLRIFIPNKWIFQRYIRIDMQRRCEVRAISRIFKKRRVSKSRIPQTFCSYISPHP